MTDPEHVGQAPEPIAVIGVGCRFAGAVDSPASFWELLVSGSDGICEAPADRWADYVALGPQYAAAVRRAAVPGGFLADIEGFDSAFFGLSPREAELMDPQQRVLLELAWEALEHAGIPPRSLAGSDTGVFVGIGSDDYGRRMLEDLPTIEAWTGIGSAMCAAANRVSYALDLRGPSLAVDTACSASLVATHLACQGLRAGECSVALVGGVNLIISPGLTLTLEFAGATAANGRCKPFDEAADGYGRGEGGGMIVLKRLNDAERDGDRVLAVIRGSAIRQDGRTNGIMAPNGDAQREVLQAAVRRAGVTPESIGYVEAHGTGTRLGDPLEAGAISAVYSGGRDGTPLLLGSVKPNIGHLEAGAGVASIIKVALALAHEEIPPSLNFRSGNPAIDWASAGLRVVTERTPWRRGDAPRRAGVSGFGYGGTISHVILEEAPAAAGPSAATTGEPLLFPLSAASEQALRQHAEELADRLATEAVPLPSAGHTLARRRSHLDHRAAVAATGRDGLVTALRALAAGSAGREASTGTVTPARGTGLVWVFSGHGAQWTGMGRELLATEPVFAAAVEELEPVFAAEIGFSPRDVLERGDLTAVDRIQTMIFVVQVGLAALWRSYGVEPGAVVGHSVGEIAAAVACGALSPQDGARLSCRRSRLLCKVAGAGAMALTALPFAEAASRLAGNPDVVAAIASSPHSTVISGSVAGVAEVSAKWAADGVDVRRVASDVAFHSPQMDALVGDLAVAATDLAPQPPRIPMYRTAVEDPRAIPRLDGAYWALNLRQPVRLSSAIRAAAEDGYRSFIEVSAHPVVAHSIRETLEDAGVEGAFVGVSLRRDAPERMSMARALGAAYCHGVDVDWRRLYPVADLVALPSQPWQRQPHWRPGTVAAGGQALPHDPESATLLGGNVPIAGRSLSIWRTTVDIDTRPYPGNHTVDGVEILPAAVVLNTFFGATGATALDDVELRLPLVVGDSREVQVLAEQGRLRLLSREPGGAWLTHTTAAVAAGPVTAPAKARRLRPADPDQVRRHLAAVGVPTMAFDWTVTELFRGETALRARVEAGAAGTWAPVLDAVLSVAPLAFPEPAVLRMVAGVGRVRLAGPPPLETVDIQITVRDDELDVVVHDTGGQAVARLERLRYASMTSLAAAPDELVHELTWQPLEVAANAGPRDILLVGGDPTLAAALRAAGARCEMVDDATGIPPDVVGDVLVAAPAPRPGEPVPEAAVRSAALLLAVAQRLLGKEGARLWCVTTGVRESREEEHLAQSPMWGLGRVLAGEREELWGGIVDLPSGDPTGVVPLLVDVLRSDATEDVIALRDGTASTARLRRAASPETHPAPACVPDATYLVTGGLGRLGLEVAGWLADRGARRLVLAGRRGLPPRSRWEETVDQETRHQIAAVRALEARGVTVRALGLDIADAEAAARELSPDRLGLPPIRGVVHAAGILDNQLVAEVDEASLRAVLRPKAAGAWTLHQLFPAGTLDFLVLFSSCGQLLNLPGQATYGAANAFLDGLAAHRGDVLSLAWTSWRGYGMAVNEAVDRWLRSRGVGDISATEGFGAWDRAARMGAGYYPVLRVLPLEPGQDRGTLLGLLGAERKTTPAAAPARSLSGLDPEGLRKTVRELVGGEIASEMRMSPTALDAGRSLVEQGLDSVMTIVVRRRLEKRFGCKLPVTLLWHQPTVAAIAEHLVERLTAEAPA